MAKVNTKVKERANELLTRWGYSQQIDDKTPDTAVAAMLLAAMAVVDVGLERILDDFADWKVNGEPNPKKSLGSLLERVRLLVKED